LWGLIKKGPPLISWGGRNMREESMMNHGINGSAHSLLKKRRIGKYINGEQGGRREETATLEKVRNKNKHNFGKNGGRGFEWGAKKEQVPLQVK